MKFEIPFRFILPLTICFQKCFLYYLCFYRPQRSWGKVIFWILFRGGVPGQVHLPWAGTPPGRYTTQTGTLPRQVHPPGRYTPREVHPTGIPPGRYTPQAGTPSGQYTPQAGIPRQVHPPGQVPPGQVPPRAGTHPSAQCMLGDTGNKRAVRILLECNLVIYLRCTFLLYS